MQNDDQGFGRAALLAALAAYEASDTREALMVAIVEDFVGTTPECFLRTHRPGHITGSAWIVDEERSHALLVHHRKLDRWLQPGGHADGESDVLAVARREAREESGLTRLRPAREGIYNVDVHTIPGRGHEPEHVHYDLRFAFIADRTEPLVVSEESHALAWRPLVELDCDGVDESVRRLARKTPRLP